MLAADPDAGLEMFSNMQPPLPPSAVLPILTTYAPRLAGALLLLLLLLLCSCCVAVIGTMRMMQALALSMLDGRYLTELLRTILRRQHITSAFGHTPADTHLHCSLPCASCRHIPRDSAGLGCSRPCSL